MKNYQLRTQIKSFMAKLKSGSRNLEILRKDWRARLANSGNKKNWIAGQWDYWITCLVNWRRPLFIPKSYHPTIHEKNLRHHRQQRLRRRLCEKLFRRARLGNSGADAPAQTRHAWNSISAWRGNFTGVARGRGRARAL